MKIRHHGFLANRFRKEKLALCRQLLHVVDKEASLEPDGSEFDDAPFATDKIRACRCPACGKKRLVIVEQIPKVANKTGLANSSRAPPTLRVA